MDSEKKAELRKKAVELLNQKGVEKDDYYRKNLEKLFNELNNYQVELERQNDELMRTQIVLEDSMSRYSDLYHNSPVGYATIDKNCNMIDANQVLSQLLNSKTEKLKTKRFTQFIKKESWDNFHFHIKKVLNNKVKDACEIKMIQSNNSFFYAYLESIPVKLVKNNDVVMHTAIVDITERKKVEEINNFQLSILRNITECVIVHDKTGKIIYWNKGAERVFGFTAKNKLGTGIKKMFFYEWDKNYKLFNEEVKKGNDYIGEWEAKNKNKKKLILRVKITSLLNNDGELNGYVYIIEDITEKEKIHQYKTMLSSIVEYSDDGIEGVDLNGNILSWNKGAEKIYGYKAKEIIGKNALILYTNKNKKELAFNLAKIKEGTPVKNFETERSKKNGERIDVSITFSPLKDEDGKIYAASVITHDITKLKKNQRVVKESELKYKTIFENSGEGLMLIKDAFIVVNKKTEEITGYSKKEFVGKTPIDFSPEYQENGEKSSESSQKYIKTAYEKGFVSFYWQLINKKSEIVHTKVTLNRITIEDEPHLITVVHDLTELSKSQGKLTEKTKELEKQNKEFINLNEKLEKANQKLTDTNNRIEESEWKFKSAFKTSPDAVNINRMSDGLYLEINKGFTNLTGYTEKDVKGKTSLKLNIWSNQNDRKKLINKLKEKGVVSNFEAKFRKKDGSITTALMSATIIEINQEKCILSITRDISERKKFEEKLKLAMKKAEESDRLKSSFLANMSHEIRTPMNAILGFTQLLKEKKQEPEKQTKYLNIIISRSKNLLEIINDIIDISKIEANQLDIELSEFSINKMFYELFANYEMELFAQNKNEVKLEYKADPFKIVKNIETDEVRLKQILNNLLNNAVKFTEKGEIEFGYKVKDKYLEFFVKDTGIGIPEELHNHIFERFRQADSSSTRHYGGTGLGLSICKQLTGLLGGEIWLESQTSENSKNKSTGTTFYFTIPHVKKEQLNDELMDIDHCFKQKTILLVEDDIISMTYLEELLYKTKAKIIKAFNGEQALEKFRENKDIDLVLMDIHLPKMSGNEATVKIKEINSKIPVIAQSAFAMKDDKQKSFKSGCDEYLIKPIDAKLFYLILKKYLQ